MSMLVFLEHDAGAVSPGSLGVLTKAAALGADAAAIGAARLVTATLP